MRYIAVYFYCSAVLRIGSNTSAPTNFIFGSEVCNDSATFKEVIKAALKLTIGFVLGTRVNLIASDIIQIHDNQYAPSPPILPIVVPKIVKAK